MSERTRTAWLVEIERPSLDWLAELLLAFAMGAAMTAFAVWWL